MLDILGFTLLFLLIYKLKPRSYKPKWCHVQKEKCKHCVSSHSFLGQLVNSETKRKTSSIGFGVLHRFDPVLSLPITDVLFSRKYLNYWRCHLKFIIFRNNNSSWCYISLHGVISQNRYWPQKTRQHIVKIYDTWNFTSMLRGRFF